MSRIAGIAGLLLLFGCGGDERADDAATTDGDETTAPARVAACDVLGAGDVTEVLGATVTRTDPREVEQVDSIRYLSLCTYIAERGQAMLTSTLSIQRAPDYGDPAASLSRHVEGIRGEGVSDYNVEPVPQFGPGAAWEPQTATLMVFRPQWGISIVMDPGAPNPRQGAETLMTKVLERLP